MESEEYEVIIVRYGTRATRRSEVFLNYAVYTQDDEEMRMDYFFWVLRNSERIILVDTGFSEAGGEARNRTTLMRPVDAMSMLGIDVSAPLDIILTHAHYDHAGNLDALPRSRIIMAAKEYEFWTGVYASRVQFAHSIEVEEIETLRSAMSRGRVRTFADRDRPAPGVELIEVGGHTPGQLMVQVQTAAGSVLIASDAVHYYEELHQDMPFAFVADLPRMYGAFDRVREMQRSGQVTHVLAGHDPAVLGLVEPGPEALGDLAGSLGRIGGRP